MIGWKALAACALAAGAAFAFAAAPQNALPGVPSVAQIVEGNATARGGVSAWRKVETMAWAGHTESGNAPGRVLSFLLEQKRPGSTRFEVMNDGQRSIRVYDGSNGWKLRPNGKGQPDLQMYSEEELRFARGAQVIDGPLMDYAAKGAAITLGGVGEALGRRAYVLDVKLPSGGAHRVWVDAQSYLELRHDREVRSAAGQPAIVSVFYRDYREFEGLKIPVTIETGDSRGVATNRLVIEKVALNPVLEEGMFVQPALPSAKRRSIVVDTRSAANAGAIRALPAPPAPLSVTSP